MIGKEGYFIIFLDYKENFQILHKVKNEFWIYFIFIKILFLRIKYLILKNSRDSLFIELSLIHYQQKISKVFKTSLLQLLNLKFLEMQY